MNDSPEIDNKKVEEFLCENCGADAVFDPKSGMLACLYCESTKIIKTNTEEIEENSFLAFQTPEASNLKPIAENALQVNCESCGATVNFVPPETATSCDFCSAKIVAQPIAANPLVAPEGVLPFSIASKEAVKGFKSWTSSRWFAPNALKTLANHDRAHSIYIPYWTFDANASTEYQGQRGVNRMESYTYTDREGKSQTGQRVVTDWFSAYGRVFRHFDDVPIPASTSVLPQYLKKLSWDLGELTSYNPAYLAGHRAQSYQVTLEDGYDLFRSRVEGVIENDVRNDIGGDSQVIDYLSTDFSEVTFKHILVPVYAGAYKFNEKVYQVIINGRTGEVYGERPYSPFKIGCLVVSIIAVILFIIILLALLG